MLCPPAADGGEEHATVASDSGSGLRGRGDCVLHCAYICVFALLLCAAPVKDDEGRGLSIDNAALAVGPVRC